MKKTFLFITAVITVATALTGCQSKLTETGFLSDYSRLKPISSSGWQYIDAQALGKYSSFIVDSVNVDRADASQIKKSTGEKVSSEEIQRLARYFRQAIITELSNNYSIVKSPGQGVGRLSMAIVSVKKTQRTNWPELRNRLSDFIVAHGGGATLEAEIVDSVTGQQLIARIQGELGKAGSDWSDWGDAEAALDMGAKQLRKNIDKAHGRFASNCKKCGN